MYESFYQLREKPFSLLPDSRFLFHSGKHDMALAQLEYGLLNQTGFTVISGGIGTGKTTLIRYMLDHLAQNLTVGLITNTHGAFGGLMEWISLAFGLPREGKDNVTLFHQLRDFIISEYARGRRTVLIVDEAQNMSVDVLEELRVLSNINADKDQLLQIILVGQTELEEKLRCPELVQFAQRIAVHFALTSLTEQETTDYITHRLEVAGGHAGLFESEAMGQIHRYSGGVPRLINVLSDAALVYGFAASRPAITAVLVHEAARDQQNGGLLPLAATVPDDLDEMVTAEDARFAELGAKAPPSEPVPELVMDSVPKSFDVEAIPAVHEASVERNARPASGVPSLSKSDTNLSGSAVQSANEEEWDRPHGAKSKSIVAKLVAGVLLMVVVAAGVLWLVAQSEKRPDLVMASVVTPMPAKHIVVEKLKPMKEGMPVVEEEPHTVVSVQQEKGVNSEAPKGILESYVEQAKPGILEQKEADGAPVVVGAPVRGAAGIHTAGWIADLAPGGYTIQIASMRTKKNAYTFIRANHLEEEAAYFTSTRNGIIWHSVILGAYPSYAEAKDALKGLAGPLRSRKPWIRSIGRIQQVMSRDTESSGG